MNWRDRLEFTGVCMAAVAFLVAMIQLAGYWRFGDLDEWAYAVLDHGSPEQFMVLAWLALTIIFISARE